MDPTDSRAAPPVGDRPAEVRPPHLDRRPADPPPAAERDAELHRRRIDRLLHGDEPWAV